MKNDRQNQFKEHWKRSITKTVTYRIAILVLDFTAVFILTGKYEIALGFMLISNVYTTAGYYIHERIWDMVKWGKRTE